MIKYNLRCTNAHSFEGWFRSSEAFERQCRRGLVQCTQCGSTGVERAPMAPAIVKSGHRSAGPPPAPPQLGDTIAHPTEVLRAMKRYVMANSEDVGSRFAAEARKIHDGEAEGRLIRGETTPADARSLAEDGVPFSVLPLLPEDHN